ncbi:MAG: N-acetyl-gamma-glutamyl-phosphate reductase [Actinomycetota bacterium]|jgi:N-acetyl-gamma-glutamyl-phosphate reductase|nr:N-acetyl-gamma-glutamyl-phosphate reductase [Actinomycetota bacterium]
MTDVAIIGAPGYAGVELTRLVLGHPDMRLTIATSGSEAGRRIDDVYPAFTGLTDLSYVAPDVGAVADCSEVVFLAVPHTVAMEYAAPLLARGVRVIDASADFRLKDVEVYEHWYGVAHKSPDLLKEAVYGLPEMDRTELADATLIACPGCYPTAAILAALPALEAEMVSPLGVIIDAKSGVSGAGRAPTAVTHYPSANESMMPYKVGSHRHTPEIEQGFSLASGQSSSVTFVPHLVPMNRGMLATVYLRMNVEASAQDVVDLYLERYGKEPFVSVHAAGRMPATSEVRGSNRAHIGLAVDESAGLLIASCAIDNLVKGTSGQAIQCANIASGYEETAGLMLPVPVI